MGGSEVLAFDASAELIFDMSHEQFSNSDSQFCLALKTQFINQSWSHAALAGTLVLNTLMVK